MSEMESIKDDCTTRTCESFLGYSVPRIRARENRSGQARALEFGDQALLPYWRHFNSSE
jgi:hypothetical protein